MGAPSSECGAKSCMMSLPSVCGRPKKGSDVSALKHQPRPAATISRSAGWRGCDGRKRSRNSARQKTNLPQPGGVAPFMNIDLLDSKFARIGARLKVADRPAGRSRMQGAFSLDVQTDRRGEYYEIARRPDADAEVEVLDVRPADRHLLLLVREGGDKHKFLCGHDERHWFVAGIPESAPVGTVPQAKEALKPAEVRAAQAARGLRAEKSN